MAEENVILELIACTVCSEDFDEEVHSPKTLQCGHTFCGHCTERLLTSTKIKCPTCRREHDVSSGSASGLPTNFLIIQLVDTYKGKKNPLDASCGLKMKPKKDGTICKNCNVITDLKDTNFCKECKICACKRCSWDKHRTHPCGSVLEHYNKIKRIIKETCEAAEQRKAQLEEESKYFEEAVINLKTKFSSLKKQIREHTQRILDVIQQEEKEEIAIVKAVEKKELSEIEEMMKTQGPVFLHEFAAKLDLLRDIDNNHDISNIIVMEDMIKSLGTWLTGSSMNLPASQAKIMPDLETEFVVNENLIKTLEKQSLGEVRIKKKKEKLVICTGKQDSKLTGASDERRHKVHIETTSTAKLLGARLLGDL